MHVAKLRIGADEDGLIPAGAYFERLASALREANAREAASSKPRAARPRVATSRFTHEHHGHA